MMQMMAAPDGKPVMAMVAKVVRSESLVVGWVYHLFDSAVIGGIFGWLLGNRISGYGTGLLWGALYGIAWWILGGLILMPMFLGMSPFAPLTHPLWVGSRHQLYTIEPEQRRNTRYRRLTGSTEI